MRAHSSSGIQRFTVFLVSDIFWNHKRLNTNITSPSAPYTVRCFACNSISYKSLKSPVTLELHWKRFTLKCRELRKIQQTNDNESKQKFYNFGNYLPSHLGGNGQGMQNALEL